MNVKAKYRVGQKLKSREYHGSICEITKVIEIPVFNILWYEIKWLSIFTNTILPHDIPEQMLDKRFFLISSLYNKIWSQLNDA